MLGAIPQGFTLFTAKPDLVRVIVAFVELVQGLVYPAYFVETRGT